MGLLEWSERFKEAGQRAERAGQKMNDFNDRYLEPLARPGKIIVKGTLGAAAGIINAAGSAAGEILDGLDECTKPSGGSSSGYDYKRHYGAGHHHGH